MDKYPIVKITQDIFMPLIGLGTLGIRQTDKLFNLNQYLIKALDFGYKHFDTAPNFQNQHILGDAFQKIFNLKRQVIQTKEPQLLFDQSGLPLERVPQPDQNIQAPLQQKKQVEIRYQPIYLRENLFFSIKVFNLKNKSIQQQIRTQLNDLKLTYVDLVYLNFSFSPPQEKQTQEEGVKTYEINHLPLKQAWKQMEACLELGLCKTIGVSNFTCQSLLNLIPFCKIKPIVAQIQSHPFLSQELYIKFCRQNNIQVIAFCPLCRGGKDQKVSLGQKVDLFNQHILKEMTEKYKKSVAQLVLNWQIWRGVGIIFKSEKPDRLREYLQITDFQLLEQDKMSIQSLNRNLRCYLPRIQAFWNGFDPFC